MTKPTLRKESIELGLAHASDAQSIVAMAGSMAACRQTWCWRRAESSVSGSGGSRKRETLEHLKPQSPLTPSDTLPPTRPLLLIVPFPVGLWGPFSFTSPEMPMLFPEPKARIFVKLLLFFFPLEIGRRGLRI